MVDVHLVNGHIYRGLLYSFQINEPVQEVILRMTRRVNKNGKSLIDNKFKIGSTLIIECDDISYISILKASMTREKGSLEINTDGELSSSKKTSETSFGRDLQSIDSAWLLPETKTILDSGGGKTNTKWDQFEVNRRLYNVPDTFDEKYYTKVLDYKTISKEQLAHAEKIANLIENTVSVNIHLQEERGQINENEDENWNEEDRYSGVIRQSDHFETFQVNGNVNSEVHSHHDPQSNHDHDQHHDQLQDQEGHGLSSSNTQRKQTETKIKTQSLKKNLLNVDLQITVPQDLRIDLGEFEHHSKNNNTNNGEDVKRNDEPIVVAAAASSLVEDDNSNDHSSIPSRPSSTSLHTPSSLRATAVEFVPTPRSKQEKKESTTTTAAAAALSPRTDMMTVNSAEKTRGKSQKLKISPSNSLPCPTEQANLTPKSPKSNVEIPLNPGYSQPTPQFQVSPFPQPHPLAPSTQHQPQPHAQPQAPPPHHHLQAPPQIFYQMNPQYPVPVPLQSHPPLFFHPQPHPHAPQQMNHHFLPYGMQPPMMYPNGMYPQFPQHHMQQFVMPPPPPLPPNHPHHSQPPPTMIPQYGYAHLPPPLPGQFPMHQIFHHPTHPHHPPQFHFTGYPNETSPYHPHLPPPPPPSLDGIPVAAGLGDAMMFQPHPHPSG